MAKETFVESLADPRSGAQVFVRKYDTEAYDIYSDKDFKKYIQDVEKEVNLYTAVPEFGRS